MEPRTKIPTHFKGSDGEIAFLKFQLLPDTIMQKLWIINSRRKWNFTKVISPSEPLKCVGILVVGSKYKFNVLQKIDQNFLCSVHRNLCTMHRFLCTVHRKLICPYWKVQGLDQKTKKVLSRVFSFAERKSLKVKYYIKIIKQTKLNNKSQHRWGEKEGVGGKRGSWGEIMKNLRETFWLYNEKLHRKR